MMKIKHDLRGTLWCGPAAISAVTGLPTSRIQRAVQMVRRDNQPVQGMNRDALVLTLQALGFHAEMFWAYYWTPDRHKPTLVQFHRHYRPWLDRAPVIVNITGHFVVLSGDQFVDCWTKKPVPFARAPHRRCRVKAAWRIYRTVLDCRVECLDPGRLILDSIVKLNSCT